MIFGVWNIRAVYNCTVRNVFIVEAAKKRTYNTTFRNTAPRMSTVRVPVSIPGAPCVQVEAVHTRKDRTHGLQEWGHAVRVLRLTIVHERILSPFRLPSSAVSTPSREPGSASPRCRHTRAHLCILFSRLCILDTCGIPFTETIRRLVLLYMLSQRPAAYHPDIIWTVHIKRWGPGGGLPKPWCSLNKPPGKLWYGIL